jgi:hypothetical protein
LKLIEEDGKISIPAPNEDGVYVLYLPPWLMNPNAAPEVLHALEKIQQQMQDVADGKTKCICLPSVYDEQGNRLFEFVQPTINVVLPSIKHIESVGDITVGHEETNLNKQEEIKNVE